MRQPLPMIYGREDRANAALRAGRFKALYPHPDLHILPGCRHLAPWDVQSEVDELTTRFLKRTPAPA